MKFALTQYLNPLNHKCVSDHVQKWGLDKYVKKFDTVCAAKLFIFAQVKQIQHYTDISQYLNDKKELQQTIGLASISTSQLSRKWRSLDSKFLARTFQHVVRQTIARLGHEKATNRLQKLTLIDSSTISLCLTRYRWAEMSKHKSGVKFHLRFIHTEAGAYPEHVTLTHAKVNDRTQMDELVTDDPEVLHVFDRGYVNYKRFDQYCGASIRFVTRLLGNADFDVVESREVAPGTSIVRDAIIFLGPRNTRYVMKHPVRLVECLDKDGEPFMVCTNDLQLSAEEIAEVYRRRWQIELFFKWIKQHFHVKKCYGTSLNAVYNQIYTALIAFCLTLLIQAEASHTGPLLRVMKVLRLHLYDPFASFLQALFRKASRPSKGRGKTWDAERIFKETLHQYEAGEAEHLDDLTYDPIH